MVELCTRENTKLPLVVFAVIIVLFGAFVAFLVYKNKDARVRGLVMFALVTVLFVAIGAGVTRRASKHFDSYAVSGATLTLGYPWPRGDVALPLSSIRHVTVEREQYVTHGKSGAGVWEHGWLLVDGTTDVHHSCETQAYARLAESGTALATATQRAPTWELKCADGHDLETTEQIVGTPRSLGGATYTSLCGSAKSPADFR